MKLEIWNIITTVETWVLESGTDFGTGLKARASESQRDHQQIGGPPSSSSNQFLKIFTITLFIFDVARLLVYFYL